MTNTPQVHEQAEQPYVSLHHTVAMDGFADVIDTGYRELFGWLDAHGIAPASAPIIRYNRIDMANTMDIELAVPISAADAEGVHDDGRITNEPDPAKLEVEVSYRLAD